MSENMEKAVAPFSAPSSKSDLILIVEGQKLYASKLVLSLLSPVFERMFGGDFKEKSCSELQLPKKPYEGMVEFLLCVYPSTQKPITRENLDVVLPLADEYQVQSVKDRCESFILALFENKNEKLSVPNNMELVHFLFLADKYRLKKLLAVCIEMSKYRTFYFGKNCIIKIPDFQLISGDTRYQMLLKRVSLVETGAKDVLSLRRGAQSDLQSKCFAFET